MTNDITINVYFVTLLCIEPHNLEMNKRVVRPKALSRSLATVVVGVLAWGTTLVALGAVPASWRERLGVNGLQRWYAFRFELLQALELRCLLDAVHRPFRVHEGGVRLFAPASTAPELWIAHWWAYYSPIS